MKDTVKRLVSHEAGFVHIVLLVVLVGAALIGIGVFSSDMLFGQNNHNAGLSPSSHHCLIELQATSPNCPPSFGKN